MSARSAARRHRDEVGEVLAVHADRPGPLVIGGFVLAQMKKNGIGVQSMTYESVRFMDTLNNDRDRALFGLAAKPALSPTGEAGGAVS